MNPLFTNTMLVTMDVTALYTNIPHADCIDVCKEVWESSTYTYKKTAADYLSIWLQWSWKTTAFFSQASIIYKSTGRPWALKWLHHMPLYSWVNLKSNWLNLPAKNHFVWTICWRCWYEMGQRGTRIARLANDQHPSISFTDEISKSRPFYQYIGMYTYHWFIL